MSRRRTAALAALALAVATIALAAYTAVAQFPVGPIALVGVLVAVAAAFQALLRSGAVRLLWVAVAVAFLAAAVVLIVLEGRAIESAAVVALTVATLGFARAAFVVHVPLPRADAPRAPVLFVNPKSGGGKAERFALADEARARGIEVVELRRDDDLEQLARDAVARGAGALAMAGGDGSQAIVATVASEHDLPYACIPSGTRNHFALDLGVDRDDVVGALEALVDGGERRVDLAEVNGRVFVNNVSLGVYAEAVQRSEYRDAKVRTLLDTVPDVLGPTAGGTDLKWTEPDGSKHRSGAAILVSNNRYRLGHLLGSGTRPSIEDGELGIAVLDAPAGATPTQLPWREWSSPSFEVGADAPVPAGIDGEATVLEPPLRFGVRPGVLRVRVATAHPGASPSAGIPESAPEGAAALARIAVGREEQPAP
jgi:diacylglycerol kinase family enzyme